MKINQYFITNDDRVSINDADFSESKIDDYKIFSHCKLKVSSFSAGTNALIILGDIFDPNNPEESNYDIGDMLIKSMSLDDMLKLVDKLTGRYVLFIKIQEACYLVSDFFCQRQIYYWFNTDKFYASSSSKMILDVLQLDIEIDEDKLALSKSNYFLKIHEHWLLGDTDWDNRFKKVLPNHFLNINKHTTQRIPIYVTKTSNKAQLQSDVISILKRSIEAYAKRYKLMLGLTSGFDSRLLLAVSYALKQSILYFTFNRNDTYVKRDEKVANQLAKAYNLNYKSIELKDLNSEFILTYKKQFLEPRFLDKTKNIQWFKSQNLKKTAVVSGNGGALIRSIYSDDDFLESDSICKAIEYEQIKLHLNAVDSWLEEAKVYADKNNILISDLFYLEVRLGKWGNKMVHEMDVSNVEEFTPYNNRNLMYSLLLNYNKDERKTITLNLLEESLDGVTKFPFNPNTWKDAVKKIIFYEHYKKWIQKIK